MFSSEQHLPETASAILRTQSKLLKTRSLGLDYRLLIAL
jgi:hypothetical protein